MINLWSMTPEIRKRDLSLLRIARSRIVEELQNKKSGESCRGGTDTQRERGRREIKIRERGESVDDYRVSKSHVVNSTQRERERESCAVTSYAL